RAFMQLAAEDHSAFVEICYTLLQESEVLVRGEALKELYWYGDRDDPIAEAAAREALQIAELRSITLYALRKVGTPAIVPLLLKYAEQEPENPHRPELVSLAKQVRTEEQRQAALHLARQALFSQVYYTRDAALIALRYLSNAAAEEDLLLQAYRIYADELV